MCMCMCMCIRMCVYVCVYVHIHTKAYAYAHVIWVRVNACGNVLSMHVSCFYSRLCVHQHQPRDKRMKRTHLETKTISLSYLAVCLHKRTIHPNIRFLRVNPREWFRRNTFTWRIDLVRAATSHALVCVSSPWPARMGSFAILLALLGDLQQGWSGFRDTSETRVWWHCMLMSFREVYFQCDTGTPTRAIRALWL